MDCSIDSTAKRQARSPSGDGACRCQLDRYREIDESKTCLNHWLKADFIVNRISKALLAAKVSLRRLNAHMAEQELNLLELPAGLVTQTRACAPHVVGSHIVEAAFRTSSSHNTPDDFWTESRLSNPLGLVDGPKDRPIGDTGGDQPAVHCRFDPCWHRYCPYMPTFADKVGDYPVLLSLLQILHGEGCCLGSPKPASEEHCHYRVVALAAQIPLPEYCQEPPALFGSQPVANPHSMFLNTLDPSDPGCEIWAQEPAIGGLVCKSANGRQAQIDSG
jgi:hypothetical protein